jgi:PAS domain S-box-containing protein
LEQNIRSQLSSSLSFRENMNELLLKSINSIEDYAIFLLDSNGYVQTWNDGARVIKGWHEDDILGKHFSLFYTQEDISEHMPQRALSLAATKGRFEEQGWRLRKGGETFWANILVTAVGNHGEKEIAYSMVIRDLTMAKQSQDKISELQESIRIRDEFISVASHELRTPVTRILLSLQLLRRTVNGVTDRMFKSLDVCESSTKELIGLMDNLVDITRLRLGRLEVRRTKTNITTLLVSVLSNFSDQIRLFGNKVTLDHDGEIVGYWDQARLDQLFSNLLSNSLKYASGKEIRMELRKFEDHVVFYIEDDGPGIPSDLHKKIFERFERAVDSSKVSGLGLGLYVSRTIVEAHKGEISLQSERGKGAKFAVRLPFKQEKSYL